MADGQIIIDTKLNDDGAKKGLEDIGKVAQNAGKQLETSMNNAEKSMKKASSAFDGAKISKQLDIVSKSIDNTSKKIELQQHKLDTLKAAYEKAMNPVQKNKIAEQIASTEGKIISLQSKLNSLKDKQINLKVKMDGINELDEKFKSASMSMTKDLDNVANKAKVTEQEVNKVLNIKPKNPFSEMGESISQTGEKITGFGESLTTKVTLPIAALGALSGKAAAEFEHEMADVAKEVKAKGENVNEVMSQMSANSLKWSEDFGQSTNDINKGFLILVKDGYSGAESMNIMNTALETARGANEDLFTVIDQLGGSLEAYGQKTDNAAQTTANMAHMADTFAYISNHTKASISSLGEAFSTCGQTAAALGQPMEQTAAAIGILQSSNIDAGTAATSLKAGLVNLTKPTKQMKTAMQELGLQAFDSNGKMKDMATIINDVNKGSKNMTDQQKQAAIAMIFGKESLASWNVLVGKGGDYLKNLADSAGNATGEVKELSDSMKDTPVNKMKEFEASAKALGITFGEDVLPSLTPIINDLTEMLKSFSELDEGTKKQIIDFALMAAAAGPLLTGIGKITSGIGSLVALGGRIGATFGIVEEGAELGGVALTGFSTAALAATGVGTALVAGVAGIITYNELLGKSVTTSTDGLNAWEKAVNVCTGSTIKSKAELQKAGLVYKDFGKDVSASFKQGIEEGTKAYHDFEMTLTGANMGSSMSAEGQSKVTSAINKMFDSAKNAITSRKAELQNELSNVDIADGSGIDADEQKVLDEAGKGFDEKLSKIDEIQKKITDKWNKAIAEHGKLSEQDVAEIKKYMTEVKQIQAEVEAKNDAESSFAKNQYAERLNGISGDDAAKEYTEAAKTVKDNFTKLKATYKTGIDDLTKLEKEATAKGNTEVAADYRRQIDEKTKSYEDAIGQEQSQIREYLNMLYAKNPNLEGNMNEITGEMFNTHDKNAQADLYNIKKKYEEVASATKDGIKHVQDASGNWHDIYVTVDQETGRITTAFDTFNGEFGGYSAKFEDQARTMSQKVNAEVRALAKDISEMPKNLKINDDNSISKIDTGETITKLDTVIEKADKTKVAIQSINGVQVKLEFDENGALKNADDVKNAVTKKMDTPAKIGIDVDDKDAVEKFKKIEDLKDKLNKSGGLNHAVTIDDKSINSIDEVINKLENWPKGKDLKLKIDDETVTTIDGALEKLGKIPKETNTKLNADGAEFEATASNAIEKLEEIKKSNPNAKISIDGGELVTIDVAEEKLKALPSDTNTKIKVDSATADNQLDTTKEKSDKIDGKEDDLTVKVDANNSKTLLDDIVGAWTRLVNSDNIITKTIKIAQESSNTEDFFNKVFGKQTNYTGTNNIKTGLSYVNEHGYETAKGNNVKMLSNGLAFLIGNHYSGGDGINDHMTTVNEMHNDITDQVGNSIGRVINTLLGALSGQGTLLNQIIANTAETVNVGEKGNQLNAKMATDLVNNLKSNTNGTFSTLENEIISANQAKDKADKMKVEDNKWYSSTKAQYDSVMSRIDDLRDKIDETTDENTKKQLEAQQKVLEKQKDTLDKEVNYYKDAAQKEIDTCKENAEEQVKIAEQKKEQLTQLAEATTTALKNKYEAQKKAAEDSINIDLTDMENAYNKKVKKIEDDLKNKTDAIDKKLKALEKQNTDNSRQKERDESNNNIFVLQNKIKNTASEADKRSFQLELEQAQKDLKEKEDTWNIEDQKQALEDEKTLLEQRADNRKKSLEEQYNQEKAEKEKELKDTDAYYDKLLEEDSINAQARYLLLQGNQDELVKLLQSYNPLWQDAGQSLADSLLTGLNSKKESIKAAVADILGAVNSSGVPAPSQYYDTSTGKMVGYASGTNYNQTAGLYDTNEQGFELRSSGDVAYINQGAGIKNHMESLTYIDSEIASQVAMMKVSIIQSNLDIAKSLGGMITKATNTNNNNTKIYQPILQIQEYNQYTNQDLEQISNEFGVMAYRQRTS